MAAAQKAQAVGDFAAAARDYKEAVRLSPGVPELWANLGLMQHESGNISGAVMSFQHANRLNPSLYVPNLFLGIDLARTGKANQAIPFLIKATKDQQIGSAGCARARPRLHCCRQIFRCSRRTAASHRARSQTRSCLVYTWALPASTRWKRTLARLSTEGKDSPFAGALYAESLQKQARFGEAATLYKSLLDSQPQPPCLRAELGFSLLREHDPAGAADAFAAERTAHPECGLALLGQARMALAAGDNHQAATLLSELWNRDHWIRQDACALFFLRGCPRESVSAFVNFISAQKDAEISGPLADALLAAFGDSNQIPANRATASEPDTQPASGALSAEEYYRAGQFENCADRLASNFSTLNSGNLRLLAACASFTGDDQLAARAASALGAAQPHSLEALYWSIQANERLALQALARFQQLEPDSARSHVLLGDIFHQLERHDDAQAEYQKALAIAPGDPAALLGLASAYLSNNNNDRRHRNREGRARAQSR